MTKNVVAVFEAPLSPMRYIQFNGIANILGKNFSAIIYGVPSNLNIDISNCKFQFFSIRSFKLKIRRHKSHYKNRNTYIPLQLFTFLLKLRPNIILSSGMSLPTIICIVYKLIFNTRMIIHTEGTPFTESNITISQKILRKWLCRKTDGFLVGGKQSYEYIKSLNIENNKIYVAPYTTDTKYFKHYTAMFLGENVRGDQVQKRLIYVGQLIKRKGVDNLLNIFAKLLDHYSDFELWIIGDGEERNQLETQTRNLGISRNVTFYGTVNNFDLPRYFAQCDVFIFPSMEDTFAIVISEAMAAGLPVISNKNVGANDDLIVNGETGFVVDFNNVVDVINTIKYCFENLDYLKKNVYGRIENWSNESAIQNILLSFEIDYGKK